MPKKERKEMSKVKCYNYARRVILQLTVPRMQKRLHYVQNRKRVNSRDGDRQGSEHNS
jgi:hypothetical protein